MFTATVKIILVTPNGSFVYNQRTLMLGRNGTMLTPGVSTPVID